MSDRRNGLYYESIGIRNHILSRNIGEYRSYRHSMLENGGLAIGMPYAVETEFVPYTLSERSMDGLHLNLAITKEMNPKINVAWREGGLFGYTHEVINSPYDWISRNQNILQSYFDYQSTEEVNFSLSKFPLSLPWNDDLRAYSSFAEPQNTVHFTDYPVYIKSLFTDIGLSFEKSLGERYVWRLMETGFNPENIDGGALDFIEHVTGYITDDIDALKSVDDTKLAYLGRILLGENKTRQILADHRTSVSTELELPHRPGINDEHVSLWQAGKSYAPGIFGKVPVGRNYIKDVSDVVNTLSEPTISLGSFTTPEDSDPDGIQKLFLKRHMRRNRYNGLKGNGEFTARNSYAEYYNVRDYGATVYSGDFDANGEYDENLPGASSVVNDEMRRENVLGDSVEGFFRGVGVYDGNLGSNEHYDEQDGINSGERDILSRKISYNQPERIGLSNDYGFSSKEGSILEKTKRLFEQHKIKTLIGRFHTSADDNGATSKHLTQTAIDPTYGISHGRNLLKLNPTYENGYDNPYCRVWTYHHQYAKMTDLIRPFTDGENFMSLDALQAAYPGRPILREGGRKSWADKTVLNRNGMVNIVPTRKIGKAENDIIRAKQCMFSIENLAWKGVKKDPSILDTGEVGPLGGRIMWFPPYNLQFNESVNVSWGSNDFIGRGEKIYSYTNTERTGTLSFTILADHPSIVDYWMSTDHRRDNPGSEEDEQKILRFYAGCENLEAEEITAAQEKGITSEYYAIKENQRNEPKEEQDKTVTNEDDTIEEEIVPKPPREFTSENSIGFYLFYPNNLSCIDFVDNPKVGVNYIVNGRNGFEFNPNLNGSENISYDAEGNGTALLESSPVTVGHWAKDIYMLTNGPGYEMGRSGNAGLTESSVAGDVADYNKKHDNPKLEKSKRRYMWGYGIDQKYVGQRLCGPNGYKKHVLPNGEEVELGNKSYKLYPDNYSDLADFTLNNEANIQDEACKFSFMDVAEAITPTASAGGYNYAGKSRHHDKVEEVRKILGLDGEKVKNGSGRKYYFAVAGGASVHGYEDLNDELSKNRAAFLEAWLKYCFAANNLDVKQDEKAYVPYVTSISGGEDDLIVNSESAKRGRFAKAVIFWDDESIKDATDADDTYNTEVNDPDNITIKETALEEESKLTDEEVAETTTLTGVAALTNRGSTRYRDEEEFFDMVKEHSPLIYKNIVDKVKYFDPVYHSITPEGFNSRLSFLHQCTRQGPTMSSSDLSQNSGFNGAGYAGNLSFGRAPICVLRLGDFFNTRIVINTVQIQYETAQWDLNPEGIGVQPMLANVTLGFSFQGGSSLGGPIQRLQNAVSFNYYANQEVYDDRADVAVYNEIGEKEGGNGELNEESSFIWMPGYGNVYLGDVSNAIKAKALLAAPVKDTTVENIHKNEYITLKAQQDNDAKKGQEKIESISQ